jgi:plasmid stabilization system protein ParE
MAFRIELSAAAERDSDEILTWLAERHAGRTGINWYLGLQDALASLEYMPSRCALAPENDHVPYEMRQLLYGRRPHIYRILFTVDRDVVRVLRIRHTRRSRLL